MVLAPEFVKPEEFPYTLEAEQLRRITAWVHFYSSAEEISVEIINKLLPPEAEQAKDYGWFCAKLYPVIDEYKKNERLKKRRLMPCPYKPPW